MGTGIGVTVTGLTLTGSAAANYTLTQPAGLTANITAAGVTITSGLTANNKVYDTTTAATLSSNSVVLAGVVSGDTANVKLSTNGYTATFASASVGTGIGVTVAGLTLTGSAAANYTLTQPAGLTANITAAQHLKRGRFLPQSSVAGGQHHLYLHHQRRFPRRRHTNRERHLQGRNHRPEHQRFERVGRGGFQHHRAFAGQPHHHCRLRGQRQFPRQHQQLSPSQIINTPPLATNTIIYRNPLSGAKILVTALLTNASSPSGDALTLRVSPASASNATVVVNGGWVFYTPPAQFTNADSFTYTVTDNYGASATATVTVALQVDNSQSQNLLIMALGNNQFLINGSGISGYTYRLQYSDTSGPFNWQALVSETADSTGKFQYTDTTESSTRLYRTVYP